MFRNKLLLAAALLWSLDAYASGGGGGAQVTAVQNLDGTVTVSNSAGAITVSRPALTGDISVPGASNIGTLATVNSSPGTYGSATSVGVVTVNGKGLVTTGTSTPVAITGLITNGSNIIVTGSGTSVSPYSVAIGSTYALSGDVVSTGTTGATTISAIQGNAVSGTTGTGSVVFNNGNPSFIGNVGIGTSPATILDIYASSPKISLRDSVSGSDDSIQNAVGGLAFATGNANSIIFYVGNSSEKARITAAGTGIGTSTPANELDVNGNLSVGYVDVSAPSNGLIVSGNVGIGTATPGSLLSVYGGGLAVGTYAATASVGIGSAVFSGYVGIGTATVANTLDIDGKMSVGYVDVSAPSNGLIVSGNVGIGSSSPTYNLTVGAVTPVFGLWDTSSVSMVNFENSGGSGIINSVGNHSIQIQTGGSTRIYASSGGVGIGTTTFFDSAAFAVQGTILQTTEKGCATGLTSDASGAINGCVASDPSLKDIEDFLSGDGSILDQLDLIVYSWKDKNKNDANQHFGFNARQVHSVAPQLTKSAGEGLLGIDNSAMESEIILKLRAQDKDIAEIKAALHLPPRRCNFICKIREWFEGL